MATIGNKDLLFYVNEDGSLNFYESQSPKESDLKQYIEQEVQQDGESVFANEEVGLVTAVAYRDPATGYEEVSTRILGKRPFDLTFACFQVRVYYVAKGAQRKIRELCRTNGGAWRNGAVFNDIGAVVAEGGGLTANVAFGQLKVYYQSPAQPKGKISVIYANLGVGNWTPRAKIN